MSVKIPSTDRSKRPLFTVILAVYNVEKYIRATLKSLENQTYPFKLLDVIVVDDGSTDSSYRIVREWAARHPNVRHLTQENAGPGAARAKALPMARGTWITVVDPDDILHPAYFERVKIFIDRDTHRQAVMLTTRVVLLNDETGALSENHPLDKKYRAGDRLSRLADEPNNIQLGATAFLLNDVIRKHELTYDHRIKPTFEDGHLIGRYLATFADPIVGLVSTARYLYRKRGDSSSLVQQSWHHKERYTDMLQYGFLDLLETVKAAYGTVPRWAQNMVLYDIMWYFKEDSSQLRRTAWIDDDTTEEFLGTLTKIMSLIDTESIRKFSLHGVRWVTREALVAYFHSDRLIPEQYFRWKDREQTNNIAITILTSSLTSHLTFIVDGKKVEPVHQKIISHKYFDQEMMLEYDMQLPPGKALQVYCAGKKLGTEKIVGGKWELPGAVPATLKLGKNPNARKTTVSKIAKRIPAPAALGVKQKVNELEKSLSRVERQLHDSIVRRTRRVRNRITLEQLTKEKAPLRALLDDATSFIERRQSPETASVSPSRDEVLKVRAKTSPITQKYRDAWVVMDRPLAAGDNGEHLYRYLKANRPDLNAFFLLSRSSSDWPRLSDEGFALVDYDSDEKVLLCLNAKYKISSDATADVMFPIERSRFGSVGKFVFLQHGVIKDDLSTWVNPKAIDLFVTSTPAEYDSIAGDRSTYRFTPNEVKMTGLPRFDQIFREAQSSSRPRDRVIVAPTWRQNLRDELVKLETDAEKAEAFAESEYGEAWLSFVTDTRIQDMGLEILYFLHPSLSFLRNIDSLHDKVNFTTFGEVSFPHALSSATVLVTDYSSVAFDAAYGNVPVVYFQYDQGEIFKGGHSTRKGYFEYETDGLGPVTYDLESAIRETRRAVKAAKPDRKYAKRVRDTFPHHDDLNCERVTQAVEALSAE